MSVIRILQVVITMNRGGAESMIMNYYRHIDRTKVQFDFLVHKKGVHAFTDEILSLGGEIYTLPTINPLFPNKYYNELRAFFTKNNQYTIVHSHINTFSAFPLKIASEFNIPTRIAHAHIALNKLNLKYLIKTEESIIDTGKHIIKLYLKKKIHKYTTHSFACGKLAGQWLFGNNASFDVINNAIDSEKFIVNTKTANIYKKNLSLENDFIIGHVGRFDEQKNHSFLLRIFADILKLKPNASLILVGDGPLRKKMEQEAKNLSIYNKTLFLGVRSDIPQLLQVMDVFAFPSLYEGLPVTLIEAQAAGLKVFASDSITDEVKITNDLTFLSIKKPSSFWAETIVKSLPHKKCNNKELIKSNFYDIKYNALNLQIFYLNL